MCPSEERWVNLLVQCMPKLLRELARIERRSVKSRPRLRTYARSLVRRGVLIELVRDLVSGRARVRILFEKLDGTIDMRDLDAFLHNIR